MPTTTRPAAPGASGTEASPVAHRVLVVDDERMNRVLLRRMLEKEGYDVTEAANGQEAVEAFGTVEPDLVLLDVMMPVMDGYEAARRIKASAGERFVPIIFLTAISNEDALSRTVEFGGDDFLTKPVSRTILRAKMQAFERTIGLWSTSRALLAETSQHHERLLREQNLARRVFESVTRLEGVETGDLRLRMCHDATFRGHLVLCAGRPSGALVLLRGRFTGEGLSSAVGAIPVSGVFREMAAKGHALGKIAQRIHDRLGRFLTEGQSWGMVLLEIDPTGRILKVWNGGGSPVLVVPQDGGSITAVPSRHQAIGGESAPSGTVERVLISPGDRALTFSQEVATRFCPGDPSDPAVAAEFVHAIDTDPFLGSGREGIQSEVADDLVLAELVGRFIPVGGGASEPEGGAPLADEKPAGPAADDDAPRSDDPGTDDDLGGDGGAIGPAMQGCRLTFEFGPEILADRDPLPAVFGFLTKIPGIGEHKKDVYMILSELFVNALDYGVLGLDSSLRGTPEGLFEYYAQRGDARRDLKRGQIWIELECEPKGKGGELLIRVSDTGTGFDYDSPDIDTNPSADRSDGLPVVARLCRELRLIGCGNKVEAVYEW